MLVSIAKFFRTWYALHLLYASEADNKEPNVEQESELKSRSITDICTELREALERLVASQAAKIDTDPEPLVLVELDIVDNSEPKAADES